MKNALSIIAVVLMAGTASADELASSQSQSGAIAYSETNNYFQGNQAPQNVFEGSSVPNNTPSVSAPGTMHTAPCIVGHSTGFSVPGFGFSRAGGNVENNCNSREETQFLAQMLQMRDGPAKQAAIIHACATDASLRNTLVAMGLCRVSQPAVDSSRTTPTSRDVRPEPTTAPATCRMNNAGQIVANAASGVSNAAASEYCLAQWRAGNVN